MGNWHNIRLIRLAEFINGYGFKPEDWSKEGLPIIRIEQLKNPLAQHDYYAGKLPDRNIIDNGDLIFSWSASLFLKIWDRGKAALNQHLFKVIPNDSTDALFLKYLIESNLDNLLLSAHGSTMQHITRKELEKFDVYIPENKSEQTRIAQILSTADKAIEQTEALIAKYQRIKTGLMQDLLTRGIDEHGNMRSKATHKFVVKNGIEVPEEWEVVEMGSLCECITKGESPNWQGFKYQEEGPLFITSENIREGFIDLDNNKKHISFQFHNKLNRSKLQFGDILINLVGASIARSAIYYQSLEANINQAVALVRVKKGFISGAWLSKLLQQKQNIQRLLGEQVETARANLSLTDLRNFLIAKPILKEQKLISKRIEALDRIFLEEIQYLTKLQSLKTGLMQDLLSRKVSVKQTLYEKRTDTGAI